MSTCNWSENGEELRPTGLEDINEVAKINYRFTRSPPSRYCLSFSGLLT